MVGVVMVVLVCLIPSACSKPLTDEEILVGIMDDVVASVEAKDIKGVVKHISEDFLSDNGSKRDDVKRLLLAQLLRGGYVSVIVKSRGVEVTGEVAVVSTGIIVFVGREIKSVADAIPEEAAGLNLSIIFRKIDGNWLATGGHWQRTRSLLL